MDRKLDELEERIKKAHHNESADEERKRDAENMNTGMRAGAELIGGIGGGAFIGWALDQWLDTSPVFLIVMLLLGIATGFYNVYRLSMNISPGTPYSRLHKGDSGVKKAPEKRNHRTEQ